jgi:hypothetical protein
MELLFLANTQKRAPLCESKSHLLLINSWYEKNVFLWSSIWADIIANIQINGLDASIHY